MSMQRQAAGQDDANPVLLYCRSVCDPIGWDRVRVEHAEGKGMVGRRLIREAVIIKRFAAESGQTAVSASQGAVFPDRHIP